MLISFEIGNFLSFKEGKTLSLEASSITEFQESNTFPTSIKDLKLLKGGVLYGPNSSGKSNLLKAIHFVKWFIINSSKDLQAKENIDVKNHKLSVSTLDKPSCFELVFLANDLKYRYGFKVDKERIHEEWLFCTKKIKEFNLFTRKYQDIKVQSKFHLEKNIKELTRPNALFLSVSAQFNTSIAIEILNTIQNITFISGIDDRRYIDYTAGLLKNEKYHRFIRTLLLGANLGFNDVKAEQIQITEEMINSSGLPPELKELVLKSDKKDYLINTIHNVYDEDKNVVDQINFNLLENESLGTRKFFSLAGPIIDTLLGGKVLIIDEFDARLHPVLSKAIIKIFNSRENNPRNAQLIFSTHNSTFLSSKIFRRDQIVLVNKDMYGASDLKTLFDWKIRKDASFEKDYLSGKYEAIPNINLPYQLRLFDE